MNLAFDITSAVKPEPTGTGRYALELFRSLFSLLGPDDRVVLGYRLSRWSRRQYAPRFEDSRIETRPLQSPFAWLSFGRPDLFHGLGVNVPLGLPGVAKFVTLHGVVFPFSQDAKTAEKRKKRLAKIAKMLHRADAGFVVSEHERRRTVEETGCDPEKLTVVYLGTDHNIFRPDVDPQIDRAALGKEMGSRPFLLYVGAITELKNVEGLLQGFARSKAKKDLDLVLAGPQRAGSGRILDRIEPLGLKDKVRVLGHVEPNHIAAWIRQSRALVHASRYEAGATTIIESLACGTPIACSNVAALPEITGGAAALFDPEDPDAIADAIDRLAFDDRFHREMREKGLVRGADFSWERSAKKTLETYRQVLGAKVHGKK